MKRVLRGAGYRFLHSRKKDLLKNSDLKKRRWKKKLTDKFWEEGIWFYIDAAGFQSKCKPHDGKRPIQAMAWRLENEGLHPHFTAKGSHVGSGGRVAYFIAAISHQKSVALCGQSEDKINRDMFSDFIKTHFQETFSRWRIPKGKRFLQDGCPVQNSKKTRQALDTVGAIKFSIPPRSQDLNPIENVFNFIKRELRTQAFEKNLNYETFEQFSWRHSYQRYWNNYCIDVKKNVDVYQVKRAKGKVLNVKVKVKFDLYRFISAKAVCLKIPKLGPTWNTLLILLCSVYLLTKCWDKIYNTFILFFT